MIDVHTSKPSDVIRYNFKYDQRDSATDAKAEKDAQDHEEYLRRSLEKARAEMANDDGRGSYGRYKCPIF